MDQMIDGAPLRGKRLLRCDDLCSKRCLLKTLSNFFAISVCEIVDVLCKCGRIYLAIDPLCPYSFSADFLIHHISFAYDE